MQGRSGVCWQMMGGYLESDEDPFTAVQQTLLAETGYQTNNWAYLGSHVTEANQRVGAGYFFCAQQARQVVATENPDCKGTVNAYAIKWVPLIDLRYALLDGRIMVLSHALTVSLALLTVVK